MEKIYLNNQRAYAEQLQLRYNLYLANRISNLITAALMTGVIIISFWRVL